MSLESLFSQYVSRRRSPSERIGALLDELRHEFLDASDGLGRQARHHGRDWAEAAEEFGHDTARHGAALLEQAGKHARRGARQVQKDPLPLIAVVGTALLLARMLERRR